MNKTLSTIFILLSFSTAASGNVHWGYKGEVAPEHWNALSEEFKQCQQGHNQSPINIDHTFQTTVNQLDIHYQLSQVDIVNNGHTIQVTNKALNNYIILEGTTYYLQQFHFHDPSENHINGKAYPIEGHFVHADKDGHLTVLAVMFEEGRKNHLLDVLLSNLDPQPEHAHNVKGKINIQELLPTVKKYYRFQGSLTTPPCTEGVNWVVFKTPITASKAQIERFQKIIPDNNRPIQPTNARLVIED